MGIDLMDLAFRLEKRFAIRIDEGQCAYFLTPGQITWLVTEKLKGRSPAVPDFLLMWGRVRSALKMMPNYRARWFDTADINKLVPQEDRSTNWNALGTALGIPLPTLGDPPEFGSPSIPQTVSSMTGLLSWIMENHSDQFAWKSPATTCDPPLDADKWTNELIWDAVKSTISDALGVGADEVTPTARMVEDLGME